MTLPRGIVARVAAQAKINLFLRVLAREAGGYHQIETAFSRLDLADDVTIRVTEGTRAIEMDVGGTGPPEQNLAWRAAAAYSERAHWPRGFAIEITKRIPIGGGLGGGSANAGAVLRALDALAPTPLPREALLSIAGRLGADVPFLSLDVPHVLAWGRGERMLRLPALPRRPVLLLHFPFGVPTGDAYGWLAAARGGAAPRPALIEPALVGDWGEIARHATNDFEQVVPVRFPAIDGALTALRGPHARSVLGAHGFAILCGSGATVAAVGDATVEPDALAELVPDSVHARRVVTAIATRVEEVQVLE